MEDGGGQDGIRAADGIDGVRDAAFVQDDLLSAKRDRHAVFGRKGERLIARIGVQ